MYGNNYYQPYLGTQRPMFQQQYQQQPMQQMEQPQFQPQMKQGLQGEVVESYDVVKALNYPLNGTTSYFPTTDNSKIYTKQMQFDGSMKINTYVLEQPKEENAEQPKYATIEDIENIFNKLNYKDDIDEIKKALKKSKKEEL